SRNSHAPRATRKSAATTLSTPARSRAHQPRRLQQRGRRRVRAPSQTETTKLRTRCEYRQEQDHTAGPGKRRLPRELCRGLRDCRLRGGERQFAKHAAVAGIAASRPVVFSLNRVAGAEPRVATASSASAADAVTGKTVAGRDPRANGSDC